MVSIKEMAHRLSIPYHFLGKILQSLTYKGLLRSHKGPSGGFALAMPPQDITLFHIVEAIDGTDFTRMCVFGFSECSDKNHCSAHEQWTALRDGVYQMLISKNVAAMAKDTKQPAFRSAAGTANVFL